MNKPTILIADNDPEYINNAQEFFNSRGYEVLTASNPAQTSRALRRSVMAFAVVDWRLMDDQPNDRSGWTVVNNLEPEFLIPVVFNTRFPDFDTARTALSSKSSAPRYVVKKSEGLEALENIIRRYWINATIFINYARLNKTATNKLYGHLVAAGFKPWIDQKNIRNGDWEETILKEIRSHNFFLTCFSSAAVEKYHQTGADGEITILRKEIDLALNLIERGARDSNFIIPVRLEECEIPETLGRFQRVDLFTPPGLQDLLTMIRYRLLYHSP